MSQDKTRYVLIDYYPHTGKVDDHEITSHGLADQREKFELAAKRVLNALADPMAFGRHDYFELFKIVENETGWAAHFAREHQLPGRCVGYHVAYEEPGCDGEPYRVYRL